MVARVRSWWQQIKQHRVAIGVFGIALVIVIALIVAGYWFDWTGFNGYNKVTTTHIISGTNAGTVTRTEEYQPGRALWDWLQLLIIPLALAIIAFFFNRTERKNEQRVASDNQQEAALQEYIKEISELLLHEKLRESQPGDEVRIIARVRTLTALPRLDDARKISALEFIYEANLIDKNNKIIDLDGANLSHADLSYANLWAADLSGVNLSYSDLSHAYIRSANLSGAKLVGANLKNSKLGYIDLNHAILINADLSGADCRGEANFSFADLTGAILKDVDFKFANLQCAYLEGADLSNAYFRDAYLGSARLMGANLKKAIFWGANLEGAYLDKANLRGVQFYNRGNKLEDANLADVSLEEANMGGALVKKEQLAKVRSYKGATMPD